MSKRYVVTGGSSGLGRALVKELTDLGHEVENLSLSEPTNPSLFRGETFVSIDVTDKEALERHAYNIWENLGAIDGLINCAGINRIDHFDSLSEADWDHVMDVNAKGIFLTSQAFLPQLAETKGVICNVVSNASHMPMTHSAAYNASKGAAHILTLQMARELTRTLGVTVFGVSPAKLSGTGMSDYIDGRVPELRGWTPEQAREYQLAGLLTGAEIPPTVVAEFIAHLITVPIRHKYLTGCVIPYGA